MCACKVSLQQNPIVSWSLCRWPRKRSFPCYANSKASRTRVCSSSQAARKRWPSVCGISKSRRSLCRGTSLHVLQAVAKVVEGTPQVDIAAMAHATFHKIAARVAASSGRSLCTAEAATAALALGQSSDLEAAEAPVLLAACCCVLTAVRPDGPAEGAQGSFVAPPRSCICGGVTTRKECRMPTLQEQPFEDFVHFAARQGSGAVYQCDPHQSVPPGCVFVRLRSPGEGSFPPQGCSFANGRRDLRREDVCREP